MARESALQPLEQPLGVSGSVVRRVMNDHLKPLPKESRPQLDPAFEVVPVVLTSTEESQSKVGLSEILIRCDLQRDHDHSQGHEVQ